jgi:ATP synthase protein I
VLRWQAIATIVLTGIAATVAGVHGGLSAAFGGLVGVAATIVFALVASLGSATNAGLALLAVLRAEAAKIASIVVLLWLVLITYKGVLIVWFIGSFLLSVLILSMAALVRDDA